MTSWLHSGLQLITKENIVAHTIILILAYHLHTVVFHLLNFLKEVKIPSLVDITSQQPQVSAILKGTARPFLNPKCLISILKYSS